MKKEIKYLIENSIKILNNKKNYNFEESDYKKIEITHPDIVKYGDFTCNISLPLSKKVSKKPRDLAMEIEDELENLLKKNENKGIAQNIEKIEIAGPGFLNFYLSKSFYKNILDEILEKEEKWGSNKKIKDKKYLNEKISPNLFKPLHIGHVVTATFSESLPRIFSFSGAEVTNISYPSNVSLGLAKAVWSLIDENKINNFTIDDIGKAYARGTQEYDKNDEIKKRVKEINKNIYNKKDSLEYEVYKIGIEKNLKYFIKVSKRLGSTFDGFIFESEAADEGLPIIKKNLAEKGKGVFEDSNGAIIFDGERRGLHTRVFVNSEGLPTYETKDIGLISLKSKKYNFDKAITCVDREQEQYFKVVKLAMSEINLEWSKKVEFLKHGRLNFVGEKISSRYGNVPLAEDLIDKVKENIFEIVKDKDFSDEEKNEMAEKIAIGALKYSFLKVTMGKNMTFDFKKSLDFSGNSGPYLQYSYVRAKSILNKVDGGCENLLRKFSLENLSKNSKISDLEKILYRFPEKVLDSLEYYSPHHIANYLYDLASEFNSFYANTKILDSKSCDYEYNIAIVKAFSQTMKNGLYLLGIETVEKM